MLYYVDVTRKCCKVAASIFRRFFEMIAVGRHSEFQSVKMITKHEQDIRSYGWWILNTDDQLSVLVVLVI